MKYGRVLVAILIIASIGIVNAAQLDVRKSDFEISAATSDSGYVLVGVSVEWQSNSSITSQTKTNVRAMTEMAVIEQIRTYKLAELQANTVKIQDSVLSSLRERSVDANANINDVLITKIVSKQSLDTNRIQCQPERVIVPAVSIWTFIAVIITFIFGIIIGYVFARPPKEEDTDE